MARRDRLARRDRHGVGPEVFSQIRDIEVDELGRVYVLDAQANEVRIFDAAGEYVRTIGGQGSGPGEFQTPNGLAWGPNGNLWVSDPRNARYSVFDTAGAYVTQYRREMPGFGYIWRSWSDGAGSLYELAWAPSGTPDGASRQVVLRRDSTGAPVDTFAVPEMPGEPMTYVLRTEQRGMVTGVPFSPDLHWLIDDGTVLLGVSDGYRIVRRTVDGDTLRIIERAYEPIPVTAAERDSALDTDYLQEMREGGADIDPGRVPAHKPVHEGFMVDDQGFLWVHVRPRDPALAGFVFDVFDPDGRYLGMVRSDIELGRQYPPSLIRGGSIYGVARDELDVQYVVRARIVGRG